MHAGAMDVLLCPSKVGTYNIEAFQLTLSAMF